MRKYPADPENWGDVEELNAKEFQIEILRKNPEYVWWGNFEDYMSKKGEGWDSCINLKSWSEHWKLDDLNECVNFYFELYRKSHQCEDCDGSGLNKATKKLEDDWYAFDNERRMSVFVEGRGERFYNDNAWCHHLTEVEIEALVRHGRLSDLMDDWYRFDEETSKWMVIRNSDKDRKWTECEEPQFPSSEVVNKWSIEYMGHDAINRCICIEARAKHLGIYGKCDVCKGKGDIYDEPEARLGLQLWMLHPRKGCSRGVYIENILENEIPEVIEYLKGAAKRNQERFSALSL